jgi:hypothetical protein
MPPAVGTVLQFVGGSIGRAAGTALVIGIFFVLFGVAPWQFVASLITNPPAWAASPYFRFAVLILGLFVIWASLAFNRWSSKQKAIDSLAEDISWAIDNLLNRRLPNDEDGLTDYINTWRQDFEKWCGRVSGKLQNRAFFTRADQLHFDYLGFVEPITFYKNPQLNNLLSQLRLKLDRLRDVINWTQQRRR